MTMIPQFILRIVGTSVLCSIVTGLMPKNKQPIIKVISGIILGITVLIPITGIRLSDSLALKESIKEEASEIVLDGITQADNERNRIIKASLEAYILEKTEQMGANIQINIELSEDSIPESIELSGNTSPYIKERIRNMIEKEIGIQKEKQHWN